MDDDKCLCGGSLTSQPDSQYGVIWQCLDCPQQYAPERGE